MKRLLWLFLALCALVPGPASQAAPETRWNFVVILADDMRADDLRVMPKARALVAGPGTTFANSFVSYPLCCPSRATLLTGQYAHNHRVLGNNPPDGGYARLNHANTLPVWLREAGYHTAHIGKYLNGYGEDDPTEVPPGWSRWFGLVDPTTYRMYDYTVNDDGALVTYGEDEADYQTDVIAVEAEAVIRSRAGAAEPFFLSVAPLAPHLEKSDEPGRGSPPRPAPRHEGRFANEPLPARPAGTSFDEANVLDKPDHVRRLPRLSPAKKSALTRTHRGRLASLLALDDLVERLVEALEETGQLDRTILVFTSDNGYFLGEHRIADGKFLPYEEAIRVPLLIRGGAFPAGHTARQPVGNIDLAATLVAMADVSAGRVLDGRPLVPLALDPALGEDRALLIEGFGRNRARPPYQAVRDARWLYVEYDNGGRELYDLRADPLQLKSRHADRATAGVRRTLASRLARLRECSGPSCR